MVKPLNPMLDCLDFDKDKAGLTYKFIGKVYVGGSPEPYLWAFRFKADNDDDVFDVPIENINKSIVDCKTSGNFSANFWPFCADLYAFPRMRLEISMDKVKGDFETIYTDNDFEVPGYRSIFFPYMTYRTKKLANVSFEYLEHISNIFYGTNFIQAFMIRSIDRFYIGDDKSFYVQAKTMAFELGLDRDYIISRLQNWLSCYINMSSCVFDYDETKGEISFIFQQDKRPAKIERFPVREVTVPRNHPLHPRQILADTHNVLQIRGDIRVPWEFYPKSGANEFVTSPDSSMLVKKMNESITSDSIGIGYSAWKKNSLIAQVMLLPHISPAETFIMNMAKTAIDRNSCIDLLLDFNVTNEYLSQLVSFPNGSVVFHYEIPVKPTDAEMTRKGIYENIKANISEILEDVINKNDRIHRSSLVSIHPGRAENIVDIEITLAENEKDDDENDE